VTKTTFILLASAALLFLVCPGCDRAVSQRKSETKEAPADAGATTPPPQALAETEPTASSRTSESQPASQPYSKDVPAGSRDPVVDGMKSLIREMWLVGFKSEQQPEISDRIVAILNRAALGEEARRKIEAELLSKTLLDVQADFKPKSGATARTALNADEEQRVRIAAEALAKDLYLKLQVAAPRHGSGQHTSALRSAPTVKVPAGYEAITWKTLGGFEYTEHMELPEEVRKLNGKKVGIAGYMMTIEEVENIHDFLLVEAFWSCCFGTPPNVNQVLMIHVEGARGVEYTSSPVLILGTIEVGEQIEDGFVTSVYRIKATSVTSTE
jgi:hypothetical protein